MNAFVLAARSGARAMFAQPGLLAALYGFNLAWAAIAAWIVASPLASLLGQHPPTTWAWAVLLNDGSPVLTNLGLRVVGTVCAYGLLASWPVAAALAVLSHSRWRPALGKPALKLLLLRSVAGTTLAVLLAAWFLFARWGVAASLGFADERLLWSTQVAVGFPFLVGLGLVSVLSHYAQISLIASETRVLGAIRAAWALIGQQPLSAIGLCLCKWVAVWSLSATALIAGATVEAPVAVSIFGQLAACLKVAVAVWAWAAGMLLLADLKLLAVR